MALIDDIRFLGTSISDDMRKAITKATLQTSTTQVSQIDITLADPGWALMKKSMLKLNMRVDLGKLQMTIASIETGENDSVEELTIQCRPNAVRKLKERTGPYVVLNVSPTQYLKLECDAIGTPLKAQASGGRAQIARDIIQPGQSQTANEIPSAWTTFKRLSQEIGFLMFESNGTICFARPSWFIQDFIDPDPVIAVFDGPDDKHRTLQVPVCRTSLDTPGTTASVRLLADDASTIVAGKTLQLSGVSSFDGDYLITQTTVDLLEPVPVLDITAATPLDPNLTDGSQPRIGTKLNSDFLWWVQAQIGDRYIQTAYVDIINLNPADFNGWELVAWGATQVGLYMPRNADQQINFAAFKGTEISVSAAINTPGAILWRPGSIGISLGGDRTIENVRGQVGVVVGGAASRYKRGARIPEMKY